MSVNVEQKTSLNFMFTVWSYALSDFNYRTNNRRRRFAENMEGACPL